MPKIAKKHRVPPLRIFGKISGKILINFGSGRNIGSHGDIPIVDRDLGQFQDTLSCEDLWPISTGVWVPIADTMCTMLMLPAVVFGCVTVHLVVIAIYTETHVRC